MKTVLVLRHGKAQQDAPDGDRKRALTERGRRDAATMGKKIRELVGNVDAVVSSDAKRANQTAKIAAEAAGFAGDIVNEPGIYGADVDTLISVVRELPDEVASVVLVGHNPGFEDLVDAMATVGTEQARLPTAGLAHLEFSATRWRDARPGTGRLVGLHTPKDGQA
jgi:phosphohistidine phosphatase